MASAISSQRRSNAACFSVKIQVGFSCKTFAANSSGELQRRFLAWRINEKRTLADLGTDYPVYWEGVLHGHLTFEGEWRPINGSPVAPVAPFQP